MNLTALLISIGVVAGICIVVWLLERIFDVTLDDIVGWFMVIIGFAAVVGIVYIFICPKEELEHTRELVYEIDNQFSNNREEKESDCPLFGDSCIVDEWDFECLFTRCIVDTRK